MAEQKKDVKIIYPDDFEAKYSNFAGSTMSQFDLQIDFGIRHDGPKGNEAKVHTRVAMSPQHAKILIGTVSGLLQNYEQTFGEISTGPIKKNK